MASELGQQTVDFSTVVNRAAEESFLSLKELVEKSKSAPDQSDTDKKIGLLKYLAKTQQRMLRLNVLAKWCQQVPLVQYCQQLSSTLSSHDTCFTQAADSLFFMHDGLQQACAPVYDVPSAIEILLTGSYQRLPKCVEDVGIQSSLSEEQKRPVLKKLDTLVRSKLLEVSLPKEISEVKVSDGMVVLRVDGEFMVLITLGYRGHLSMWRILHLELLVGEKCGLVKLEQSRRHLLGDDLECRMAAAENPFLTLYFVLHDLCVSLIMDTVIRQVQALRQGRWKDAIRFELIADSSTSDGGTSASSHLNQDGEIDSSGPRTPGLKIIYWLYFDKNSGISDSASSPSIKVVPGGQSLQIKCLHSTFIIDPLTGKVAELFLDQNCIDVEKLLLRAICCNRYTRLLEIQKELEINVQIFRRSGDVALQPLHVEEEDVDNQKKDYKSDVREHEGQEVLRVRAYGSSFFTLGINIRNGQFRLQSSRNIIASTAYLAECEDALNQGSMTAAEVFMNLRSKSILHLFGSIGRFLDLEVYEHGLPALKIPKDMLGGSTVLIMGFPDCGSSYFLLMQLDKDFKPLFTLLETQLDPSEKADSFNHLSHVMRIKRVDVSQMQIHEDAMNLSLLDWRKLHSFLPSAGGSDQSSVRGILLDISTGGSVPIAGCPASSFSSIVDDVFELEKGSSESPASCFGSISMNFHPIKAGTLSYKWDGAMQIPQLINSAHVSNIPSNYNGSLYSSNSSEGPVQSASLGFVSSGSGRSDCEKQIPVSKSDQDLASLRSSQSVEYSSCTSMDEDQLRSKNDTSKGVYDVRSSRLTSPPQSTALRISGPGVRPNGPKSLPTVAPTGSLRVSGSNSCVTTPVSWVPDSGICHSPDHDMKHRKRTLSNMLNLIPSLQGVEANAGFCKRRKVSEAACTLKSSSQVLMSTGLASKVNVYSYGDLISEANKGNTPCSIYVSALLHVVRHCSICIKHARLTSQMEALDIPYVEEVGLGSTSLNIWFQLPFARGDSWEHLCLRLGRPGSIYWDVKINDQHFRDLWELQKGSNSAPWGSGVRIANTSDIDSHIRYNPEGVVLSYQSVEADSIKKLVTDIQRLSNARMFALGMRKLLGVRPDERPEESTTASDFQALGVRCSFEADRLSEQRRRAFRIEAVGLMSLWFCFGSGILARFVVEWESGKEGCTMHVSPDQLWPHTKFLEDFINGAEVASLLDCIRLTAGPLHALAAATRPARASPIPVVPGVGVLSSIPRQTGYLPSQGLMPASSTTNASQSPPPGLLGNPISSTATGPLANRSFPGAAVLAAAGRGGPGIVPSSLLPIDVSVVLRGPYWIRIIYRKHFAVDMRCFAGDQVWLQPATPPKGGPSIGGSLPCPQFRPFIMEHVAQELNGVDTNFTAGQQVGLANSMNQNASSGSQLSAVNGNRVSLPGSSSMSRTGNQVAGINRPGNAPPPASSSFSVVTSSVPLHRSPGPGVPAHVRGELNTAIIGLGDDGGYGGGWVPLVALKKVLRGILKYLGVLWLFAQLPDLLREILGSILKDNEGALLNLDQEQPALRFFVGGYVFAVSVHRVQLLLQVLSVKKFHHQQQQQQQQPNSNTAQEELTQSEIGEICDYFSRRVASEPYDASRVASFVTLLTLPISALREFLKLIAWKKGLAQAQGGDAAPNQKPRIELCLENHAGSPENPDNSSVAKSNIHYDRPHNSVDFALTLVLDPAHIPHINAGGGAAWLPYCVSVKLRYSFSENSNVSFLGMEGSHGGRACWLRVDDWEKCKHTVARTVEINGSSGGDNSQGRLRIVADYAQRTLHMWLQGVREGSGVTASSGAT